MLARSVAQAGGDFANAFGDAHANAAMQNGEVMACGRGLNFFNATEMDNRGAANTHEAGRR
jgi:hypothetical protein